MHSHRHDDSGRLRLALVLTASFFSVELVGGWLANSLALLSDAAHMFTDVVALSLALLALWIAGRPPSESKTFGYTRAEILAALVNALALCLVVFWIAREAYGRLSAPPAVNSGLMTTVAAVGLAVNAVCAWLLRPRQGSGLGQRAAFLHVLSDLLGSVGAITAGIVILATGWYEADAVAAFFIGMLVLAGAWGVIREAVDILMESVPSHIDLERLRAELEAIPGTERLHDLHVWTLTPGHYALSAHAVIDGSVDGEDILGQMRTVLAARFGIDHVTIQLEQAVPCEPRSVHA